VNSKASARVVLIVFSLGWIGLTLLFLTGAVMGDCLDEAYSKCWAAKEFGTHVILWRAAAVELLALVVYLLFSRPRTDQ
jgi:hypothetical protein